MSIRAEPDAAAPRRRPMWHAGAVAIAVGIAPWGCGGTASPGADPETREAPRAVATAPAGEAAGKVASAGHRSRASAPRARRMAEFRRWITRRFRVPGTAHARAGERPLDRLLRSLRDLYGPDRRLRPPDLRSRIKVATGAPDGTRRAPA